MGGFGGSEGLVCEGDAGLVDRDLRRNAEVSKRLLSWMYYGIVRSVPGRRLTPPIRWSSKLNLPAVGLNSSTVLITLIASAITCQNIKVSLFPPVVEARKAWGVVVNHLWAAVIARKNNNVVLRHGRNACRRSSPKEESVVCDEAREWVIGKVSKGVIEEIPLGSLESRARSGRGRLIRPKPQHPTCREGMKVHITRRAEPIVRR